MTGVQDVVEVDSAYLLVHVIHEAVTFAACRTDNSRQSSGACNYYSPDQCTGQVYMGVKIQVAWRLTYISETMDNQGGIL